MVKVFYKLIRIQGYKKYFPSTKKQSYDTTMIKYTESTYLAAL